MRIPRIYHPSALKEGSEVTLRPQAQRHLRTVLRLRPGAPLILFDGKGCACRARLTPGGGAHLGEPVTDNRESHLEIHLIQAVARGERMDLIIQKAVELGIYELTPVLGERCVVKLEGDRAARRLHHWREILIGACEQSGRNQLPVLNGITPLKEALHPPPEGLKLLLDPKATKGLGDLPRPAGRITLLIGPEGGLSEYEKEMAQGAGFASLRLGPRILRTETAALAILSALQALWGDFCQHT